MNILDPIPKTPSSSSYSIIIEFFNGFFLKSNLFAILTISEFSFFSSSNSYFLFCKGELEGELKDKGDTNSSKDEDYYCS